MAVSAKICGLKTPETVAAAVENGADYVGFVFFETSPRYLTPAEAGVLGRAVPRRMRKVGLLVDDTDERIDSILRACRLDILQLHGKETPERVTAVKAKFGIAVMKVIKVRSAGDIKRAADYESVADMLLFDAAPPESLKNALPGGNAVSFDWKLLQGFQSKLPWMLSGGLDAANLAKAVRLSGARAVDVSSGVEDGPGEKNPSKIKEFLDIARSL